MCGSAKICSAITSGITLWDASIPIRDSNSGSQPVTTPVSLTFTRDPRERKHFWGVKNMSFDIIICWSQSCDHLARPCGNYCLQGLELARRIASLLGTSHQPLNHIS